MKRELEVEGYLQNYSDLIMKDGIKNKASYVTDTITCGVEYLTDISRYLPQLKIKITG
jgi:hypothetical protein|nr:MAG TPA: hypothetical protein [Caudoviricetes sp.]